MNNKDKIIDELKKWVDKYYKPEVYITAGWADASEAEIDATIQTQAHLAYEVSQILGMDLQEPTESYGGDDKDFELFDPIDVATVIIKYCDKNKLGITNLRLQLILYFAQASFIVNNQSPLFEDQFVMGNHGPRIPKVYNKFCAWEPLNILPIGLNAESKIDTGTQEILCTVVDNLSEITTNQLIELSKEHSTWDENSSTNIIDMTNILDYFDEYRSYIHEAQDE